jgi:peptidoglycan/LPS O-acetylase OafA/YrhL
MGVVRLFLAIAVALTHKPLAQFYGLTPLYGDSAVEGFFTISGFFIALVLCENRAYASASTFYASRYLRLWPAYILCLLVTFVVVPHTWSLVVPGPVEVFSGFSMLFQDLTLFLPQTFGNALIPQTWSLGVELSFYLIAPFTLRRLSTASLFVVVGLLTRLYLWQNGLTQGPWSYRFAPAEALYFGLGACAYHLSSGLRASNSTLVRGIGLIAACGVAFAVIDRGRAVAWGLPIADYAPLMLHDVWFQLALVVAIPFVFVAVSRNRVDRFLGDLSYPVYLLVHSMSHGLEGKTWPHLNLIFLALLLVAGAIVLISVEWPVERIRQAFIKRARDTSAVPLLPSTAAAEQPSR